MNFHEALVMLGIVDFEDRIINSNSHGELFHIYDYIQIAENLKNPDAFRIWFLEVVDFAEKNWERPESVFQHMIKMLGD
jgi:hypothetical protein